MSTQIIGFSTHFGIGTRLNLTLKHRKWIKYCCDFLKGFKGEVNLTQQNKREQFYTYGGENISRDLTNKGE